MNTEQYLITKTAHIRAKISLLLLKNANNQEFITSMENHFGNQISDIKDMSYHFNLHDILVVEALSIKHNIIKVGS